MDVKQAATNTYTIISKNCQQAPIEERNDSGLGLCHAAWMLSEIIQGRITGEKAHRWLGWAQAAAVADGAASLEDCKYANVFA